MREKQMNLEELNKDRYVYINCPTDYQQQRVKRIVDYLNSLREEAIESNGSDEIINVAHNYLAIFCNKLHTHNKILEIPDLWPIGNESYFHIKYTWDSGEHYLECEVFTDCTAKLFYRNKAKNENWREDLIPGQSSSSELIEKLLIFTEKNNGY